jgi:low affinity Fe/Cu permease
MDLLIPQRSSGDVAAGGTLGKRAARRLTRWAGSTIALAAATVVVAGWILIGPLFHWADTWLLVMNTVSSVVTFLMVFLIQRAQNKDALAVHVKLTEIVAAIEGASNHIVNVEDLSEDALQRLSARYQEVAGRLGKEKPSRAALSVPLPRTDPVTEDSAESRPASEIVGRSISERIWSGEVSRHAVGF